MSRYKIPSNLAVSDSGFLFMPNTGESFTLNEQAKDIFKMLQNGADESKIIEYMTGSYEIEKHVFERDLEDFLIQLKNYSLIVEI